MRRPTSTDVISLLRSRRAGAPAGVFVGSSGGTGGSPTAGPGLSETSGVFTVNVDDVTLEIALDTLQVKDDGITQAKIADDAVGKDQLLVLGTGSANAIAWGATEGATPDVKLYRDVDVDAFLRTDFALVVDDGTGQGLVQAGNYDEGAGISAGLYTDSSTGNAGAWGYSTGATKRAFEAKVYTDALVRFLVLTDGKIQWGSGAATLDTNLYRAAANELKTDDKFYAALGLDAGSAKITSVANGVASDDGAAFGQIPTSLPPSGVAGGVLDGTFPNPGLAASVAGAGLAETTDVLSVNVGAGIEISSDAVRIAASAAGTGLTGGAGSALSVLYGTTAGTAAQGNDSRLSDSRAPTGAAGGSLDGTYPNPGIAASVAGDGLAESSNVLSVNVDGSSIETSSDALRVKALGITNAMLAGSIAYSKLASLSTGQLLVGNAGTPTATTLGGDATIGATGTLTIANSAITDAKVAAAAAIAYSKLASLSTGQVLAGNAGTPTATTISGDATLGATGVLTIAASAITDSKVSATAAIAFSKLAALSTGQIVVGSAGVPTAVTLGGDATIDAAGALTIAEAAILRARPPAMRLATAATLAEVRTGSYINDRYYERVIFYTPALYWPLDTTYGATDQSGNSRNGTAGGGVTVGGFAGSPITDETTSTDFDDTDDRVTSAYNPFTNGTTITVSGWANRDTSTTTDTLWASDAAGATSPICRLEAGSQDVTFRPAGTGGTATTWAAAWPGNAQWVHWALVFNESTDAVSLYINGALVSTQTNTTAYNASPGNFKVGATVTSTNVFDGKIAHVALWTSALTAAQIAALYNSGHNAGALTLDGVAAAVNDLVLVKDAETGADNQLYTVTAIGSATAKWKLTRSALMDTSAEAVAGMLVTVAEGDANHDTIWQLSTDAPITLNTTALAWRRLEKSARFDHYADAGNVTTGETDLYSDSIAAKTLAASGDKLSAYYGGVTVAHATATRRFQLYFGGTSIFDSGTFTTTTIENWTMRTELIRVSSTVVRYLVEFGATTATGTLVQTFRKAGELTGLTLSNANTLKITGQSSNATNDIVAKLGSVEWKSAA